MKKIITKLITIILCFSIINIPVFPVTADVGLISVEEDFTQYSSLSDIPYLVYDGNEHSTVKLEKGKGLVIEQVKSTPLVNGEVNKTAAPTLAHIIEGTFNEDVEKRTSYRINRYAGKYKMTVDFEVLSDKYSEKIDDVTITSPYYMWKIGTVSNPSEMGTSITDKLQLRVYSASAVAYSSGTVKLATSDTVRYTSGEAHQLVMEVDTATKAVSVNIDGYKTPASGEIKSSGYINSLSITGMERMLIGSNFVIKKIKMEQTKADSATTAALTALEAITDLSATPNAVTGDITLSSYSNVTWSSSDESVIDLTGKVTRGTEDKDVTITATYKNGDTVLYKDYVLTVKALTDLEVATADVEAIDLKLGDSVTGNISLPQTGKMGTVFTWVSSHPEIITNDGKVTQGEEDTTVTLTVTGTYGEKTYSKPFTIVVASKSTEGDDDSSEDDEPSVYDGLIYVEEDFTQYSSLDEIPYFEYGKTTHATVEAVKGKGLVVTQTKSTPVLDGAVNAEQVPNIAHVIEGKFNEDAENRTFYTINRYGGKYRMTIDYEVKCDPYAEEVDGVTVSSPYYPFYFGTTPEPSALTSSITNYYALYMRVTRTSVSVRGSISSDAFTPTSVKYTDGEPHQMVVDFDTLTKKTTVNVDNYKTAAEGYLKKPGYINTFYIAGMERMKVGSYFNIKKISMQQLEEDEDTTKALKALAELPDTLAEDPFAVTEDIILPTDNEKITWSTSDDTIINTKGKITRWYADRDVVLTATYTNYDTVISKKYTLTVKELDSYVTTEIMNKSGNDLADVVEVGDLTKGSATVSDKGITVTKTIGGTDVDADDMPVYYADYRLFGEKVAYDETTKSSLSTAGYSGIYDVSFKVTPSIAGDKPVYIALGNKDNGFAEIAALSVTKGGIAISHENGSYTVVEESPTGKTYDIAFRVDTDQKKVWIYVDGTLVGTFFEFSKVDIIDTIRVILDENNALNDSVVINNVIVTEFVKNVIEAEQKLINALNKLTVDAVTSSPDTVENINSLTDNIGGYNITWSSNSKLVDVVTGNVYHSETGENVIVSATINADGVYAKKDFYLYVRAASNAEEKIAYYLSDLADAITKQNADDIRYDINLPTQHNGLAISWTSSKPEILDAVGKINKSIAIPDATDVVLTAKVTLDGTEYTRTYTYTVSPRAYERVIYTGSGAPETITVNGVENIAVACTNVTNIKFKQAGNGNITFTDANGKEIIVVNVSNGLYNISYGSTSTVDYPIAAEKTVDLDVMIMPDIDRVAVWADGVNIIDFGETLAEVSDLSSITVTGGIEVTETTITTDEYGVLDLNLANAGYFDVFAKNVVKSDVVLVSDTIIDAGVEWASSDKSLIDNVTGKVTLPDTYKFVDVTLTLTSKNYSNVKRVVTKKIAVACPADRNLALGAKVTSSVTEKTGFGKDYLTDGNLNTTFGTSYAKRTPVLTIDFGKETYFNTIYLNEDFTYYDNSMKTYTVAYSKDGTTWTNVKTGTVTGAESSLISFDTVYARYLSVTANECEENSLYINEIEAYLFADPAELVKLDVEQIDLNLGYTVTSNITLPAKGQFGTTFVWSSSHPNVISASGTFTQSDTNTTVTLTVTGQYGGETYSKTFSAYVPGKTVTGASPAGGGSAGGGGGTGASELPGFVETNISLEETIEPDVTESMFADMDTDHWAYENVKKLKELGIVNGDENGNFNPSAIVTREQFLKMLVLATNVQLGSTQTKFDDVDENQWYAQYVSAGVDAGLINGITTDTFGVGAEIIRQDMALMIARIINNNNMPVTQTSELFDDDAEVSDYAKDAVYKVRDAGIIEGYNNMFSPKNSLTRAEAATVIVKLLDLLQ